MNNLTFWGPNCFGFFFLLCAIFETFKLLFWLMLSNSDLWFYSKTKSRKSFHNYNKQLKKTFVGFLIVNAIKRFCYYHYVYYYYLLGCTMLLFSWTWYVWHFLCSHRCARFQCRHAWLYVANIMLVVRLLGAARVSNHCELLWPWLSIIVSGYLM